MNSLAVIESSLSTFLDSITGKTSLATVCNFLAELPQDYFPVISKHITEF